MYHDDFLNKCNGIFGWADMCSGARPVQKFVTRCLAREMEFCVSFDEVMCTTVVKHYIRQSAALQADKYDFFYILARMEVHCVCLCVPVVWCS